MYHQLPQSRVYIDVQIGGSCQIEHNALANSMRESLNMIDESRKMMTSPFQKGIYRQQQLAEYYWSSTSAAHTDSRFSTQPQSSPIWKKILFPKRFKADDLPSKSILTLPLSPSSYS